MTEGKELLTSLEIDERLAERDAGGGWNTRRELNWWKTGRRIVVEAAFSKRGVVHRARRSGTEQVGRLLV